jgi:hypothetical protein
MDAKTAIETINDDIVYKPGWMITAEPYTQATPRIVVHFEFNTWNSNREYFQEGTTRLREARIRVAHTLAVSDLKTTEDLMFELLMLILDTETHEAREFLRLKSAEFNAPFHPHRLMEMHGFGERTGAGLQSFIHDLHYGAV